MLNILLSITSKRILKNFSQNLLFKVDILEWNWWEKRISPNHYFQGSVSLWHWSKPLKGYAMEYTVSGGYNVSKQCAFLSICMNSLLYILQM